MTSADIGDQKKLSTASIPIPGDHPNGGSSISRESSLRDDKTVLDDDACSEIVRVEQSVDGDGELRRKSSGGFRRLVRTLQVGARQSMLLSLDIDKTLPLHLPQCLISSIDFPCRPHCYHYHYNIISLYNYKSMGL